ncbi:hypothetical protein INP57_01150 [Saccharopolyspora sp. HNM0986]|uniref:hypothetical protein n=1 Tax=Saccharopolyspora galaxeae TaxID=2781241 RepID=UPI00190DAE2E|nr:hypothetical protein [Saccharopolyspora sp. HNM0986]MBK0865410.1 hypothetical protein [Saccharopolyspora sp. HNM0986]
MAGSDDVPGKGIEYEMLHPAPDVTALGYCTLCQQPEEDHIGPDGSVSVREFHRSFLGSHTRFIDEA